MLSTEESKVKISTAAKRASVSANKLQVNRESLLVWGGRVAVGLIVLLIWELTSGTLFNDFWISKPSAIIERIVTLSISGDLWFHVGFTLQQALIGLIIGMVLGTLLGIALASSNWMDKLLYPYMMALYSLPRVALAPLFVVWFGIGMSSKIIMVIAMVIFVAFYNAYEGVKNIDKDLLDMMKTHKAKKREVFTWVILPSITVWLLTSLRLNIGMALIGAVIAELIGSNRGLGYYITYSSGLLDITGVFTGLVLIMILAVILEQLIVQSEKRLLKYR
ncbi:ABC transporter permease [Halalkalibacter oceani]|uniref:ABC transporter permease n=1 Tax=Halalkalibacter oceani TaxID=1653776 RepID=A0A9X2IL66_9BACI|nr:ABC transporter permease [Halalkalibacter oceani]MCM3712534.1 ABC transporter permease [Halalkalibacter oceani]